MEATRRWRSARFRAGIVQHAVIRVMQPSTLGVAVGFKSVRRGRSKLTATQPWDEDDSDLGASLRKLFSATATNRAASLGKTPPEARKRSSYRVNTSVFGLQDNTLVACRNGVDKERGPQRGLRQGRQSYDVRRSNSRGNELPARLLSKRLSTPRRRGHLGTSSEAREGINRGIEHRSRARCAALCQTGGNGQ
jgi:hypothetical protein